MEIFIVEGGSAQDEPRRIAACEGETLLSALHGAGLPVPSPCGGCGTCGKCRVDISRDGSSWEAALACRTPVEEGLLVRVRAGAGTGSLRVDEDAFGQGLSRGRFAPDAADEGSLGIAVDLGTTTVAAYLFDLASGRMLASGGAANPQASFGADVISRIRACSAGSLAVMEAAAAGCIRDLAEGLCAQVGKDPSHIARWAVAGNTVMQHILCGISPESIGTYPFRPQSLFGQTRDVPALGARAYLCPCVSGYVGGDITAGMVACGLDELVLSDGAEGSDGGARCPDGAVLFADLGTNGEMALVHDGHFLCCATATGPAFEGANISQGMQARDGSIDSCRFEDGAFSVTTVGAAPACGICGSGLIDALAACLEAGLVDETGRIMRPDELPAERARLVELREGRPAVLITADGSVALTQKDIRALQLAKAAVAAGVASLLRHAGLDQGQVGRFIIGGAFGAHMRPESAAAVGLIPAGLLPKVSMVGNCAGAGACDALVSTAARGRMANLSQAASYIELSLDAGFSEDYVDAMEFEEASV